MSDLYTAYHCVPFHDFNINNIKFVYIESEDDNNNIVDCYELYYNDKWILTDLCLYEKPLILFAQKYFNPNFDNKLNNKIYKIIKDNRIKNKDKYINLLIIQS